MADFHTSPAGKAADAPQYDRNLSGLKEVMATISLKSVDRTIYVIETGHESCI